MIEMSKYIKESILDDDDDIQDKYAASPLEKAKLDAEDISAALDEDELVKSGLVKSIYKRIGTQSMYVTYDMLDKKDWPGGMFRNSIYIQFELDLIRKKVSYKIGGNVYLSDEDRRGEYHAYAMRSMFDIGEEYGNTKKFRKSTYKNADDVVNKMDKYVKGVMDGVIKYTDGKYPYKQGKQDKK